MSVAVLSDRGLFGELEQKHLFELIAGASVFFVVWFGLLIIKRVLWKKLRAIAEKTPQTWDEQLLIALTRPVHFLFFFLAVAAGIHAVPNPLQSVPSVAQTTKIIFVLLAAWIVDRVAGVFVRYGKLPGTMGEEGRSFLMAAVRVAFFSLVVLILLDTLGISITPLLASLGVGSIAVALALQDTLGNLFSGFYVLIDRPVRVGDYIKLEGDVEGHVRKIGWRSTRLERLSQTLVVIPNSKISNAIVTNFNMPIVECIVKVRVGVSYDADLAQVEKVVVDVGSALQNSCPAAVPGFTPAVRYLAFSDSSIDFEVSVQARTYADTFLLKHELIKALHRRFRTEGIEIPYPQRVVRSFPEAEDARKDV